MYGGRVFLGEARSEETLRKGLNGCRDLKVNWIFYMINGLVSAH